MILASETFCQVPIFATIQLLLGVRDYIYSGSLKCEVQNLSGDNGLAEVMAGASTILGASYPHHLLLPVHPCSSMFGCCDLCYRGSAIALLSAMLRLTASVNCMYFRPSSKVVCVVCSFPRMVLMNSSSTRQAPRSESGIVIS